MSKYDWLRHLPDEALNQFAREVLEIAREAPPEQERQRLDVLIASWRATAGAYADPALRKALTSPSSGDHGPAEPPEKENR